MPYAIATYASIGVAVLGKGPVGMLLPLAAMGLFLLVTAEKKGTGTICAQHPSGRSGKLYLSPFSPDCGEACFARPGGCGRSR